MTAPTDSSSEAPRCSRRCRPAVLCVLFLFPLALRLWSIDHGSPRNYVEDTHIVKNALGMAKDKTLVPTVNKYSSYPNLLPYMLLPIYAGQMTIGIADGSFDGVEGYTNHIKEHPESAQILARILIALFGALTPWVIFRIARAAGMHSGAWVAAWLVGTCLLHVHYSVQERPWVPVVFFMALSAWPAALYAREGGMKRLVWSGVFAGLSFACHQSGAVALGIPGFAWLFGPPGWSSENWVARIKVGVAAVAGFVVAGVLLGHAYLLFPGREIIPGVGEQAAEAGGIVVGGQGIVFGFSLESFFIQLKTLLGYDPVLLLLGLAGAGGLFVRRELRPVGAFALAWAAFFFFHENHKIRYILPVAVFLPLFAGHFYETWAAGRMRRSWVLLLVALPLIPAVRFVCLMGRSDSRAVAEERLAELSDARTVIDRFGPAADLDLRSLTELQLIRAAAGDSLRVREQHRFDVLTAGGSHLPAGLDAYRLEDLVTTDELEGTVQLRPGAATSATDVAGMLRERGVTHLLLVRRDAGPHLLEELVTDRQPLWTLDPSAADAYEACRLPKDMAFPVLDLWRVERPGPWMALFEL